MTDLCASLGVGVIMLGTVLQHRKWRIVCTASRSIESVGLRITRDVHTH